MGWARRITYNIVLEYEYLNSDHKVLSINALMANPRPDQVVKSKLSLISMIRVFQSCTFYYKTIIAMVTIAFDE